MKQQVPKAFMAKVLAKVDAIKAILMPAKMADDTFKITEQNVQEILDDVNAGQSALFTVLLDNINGLQHSGLIPADIGDELLQRAKALALDVAKSCKAQAMLVDVEHESADASETIH